MPKIEIWMNAVGWLTAWAPSRTAAMTEMT